MAAKKINVKKLLTEATHADMVSKNKAGNYILRWGYFFHRIQAGKMEAHKARVAEALGKAGLAFEIVGDGDHFVAFSGGAPLQQQSHTWLEVKVQDYTPKFKEGDKVTLLANEAEGWLQEDGTVIEVEAKAGMYCVELEEVTEPDDDGIREVTEDQMIARK